MVHALGVSPGILKERQRLKRAIIYQSIVAMRDHTSGVTGTDGGTPSEAKWEEGM